MYVWTALNNWLTLTIYWKVAIVTVISSELCCCSNNYHIFATAYKYTTLNRPNKNNTIRAIINIKISTNVKNEIIAVFAVLYVKLLTFYAIRNFDFKLVLLIFEVVVLRIELFLFYFWWHNIVFWLLIWLL